MPPIGEALRKAKCHRRRHPPQPRGGRGMAARGRRRRRRIEQLVDRAGGTEEDEVRAVKVRSGQSCTTYPATTSSPEQDARRWPRIKLLRLRCDVSELGAAVGERRGHRATDQAPLLLQRAETGAPPYFSPVELAWIELLHLQRRGGPDRAAPGLAWRR
jgi:hypothetical protein